MAEADNKILVRHYLQALDADGSLDVIDEVVSPDFVGHDPGQPGGIRGLDGLRERAGLLRTTAPDMHTRIEDLVAEGDKVVARWSIQGTHQGAYAGVPPTGNTLAVTGIHIYRIADGKIVEYWAEFDTLGLLHQLGVTQLPTS